MRFLAEASKLFASIVFCFDAQLGVQVFLRGIRINKIWLEVLRCEGNGKKRHESWPL